MSQIPQSIQSVLSAATCIYSPKEVNQALDRLALDIQEVLAEKNPIVLCVMIGGLVPLGNLLLRLDFPLEVDYVHATRYRGATRGGELHWLNKPSLNLAGRTVLIVDDILDGGLTLEAIIQYCRDEGAQQVYSAVLVDKKDKRVPGGLQQADFVGLAIPDHYIFGYGMDYKGYLRNAPGIYMVAPEHM